MIWILRQNIKRITSISNLLFTKRPFFVPPIVATTEPSINTEKLLKYLEHRKLQWLSTITRWKLKNQLLPEYRAAWCPVRTRNPLWPYVDSKVPDLDTLGGLKTILLAIRLYESSHGPLFKTHSRGRPRKYDYSKIIAVLIGSTWTQKSIKKAIREAVKEGFLVSQDGTSNVPTPSLVSYIRNKLEQESPGALHEILALTDILSAGIAADIFDAPLTLKAIDWSGLPTSKYLIYSDVNGNPKLRRVAQQTTFVTRVATNTIPQVIIGEPHDVTDLLSEQDGLYLGDQGYNAVRPVMESVKRGFLFLTPQAIELLRGDEIKKLAKRLYKFRKTVERPFGNFEATRVRIRSRRDDFMFQEVLMWAIAKNIRSYMKLRELRRMIDTVGPQEKKELIYTAERYVADSLVEVLWKNQ